jgi:LysR family transcriptional activator of nhaA
MYRASVIGRVAEISEHFYAISPERRLKHDAVVAITNIARADLFSNEEPGAD